MKDSRLEYFDASSKIAITMADASSAALALAQAHLAGPVAAGVLASALAGVSLLGAEMGEDDEAVTWRLDCPGPLGGFLVESTAAGTLRGYTKKKILGDFDGVSSPGPCETLGETGSFEVIRSVPGRILASGGVAVDFKGAKSSGSALARALDAFFRDSLQRRVRTAVFGWADDDIASGMVSRAVMAECAPDGDAGAFADVCGAFASGAAAKAIGDAMAGPRTILKKLGLANAELKKTTPLSFACRCSQERAKAMLAAIPEAERADLPETLDITCHMCGRTWTVPTR